ncbi:MAG: hypothetical protein NZM04_10870, partial [Methylacidiphilales bacterium]|nr:hypothetical protein [Candidatus Methylacidiphilales bacterium]
PDLNEPRLTELALKAIVNHREDDLIVEYIDRIFSKKLLNWTEIHRFGIEIGEKYIKEIIKHSFYRNTEEFLKELFAIFEDWTSIDIEYIANLILWCDGEMLESIIRLIKKFIEHDGIIHDYSLLEIILASLVFKDSDESIRLAKYLINACRIDGLFFEESLFCLFLNESEHSLNLFFDEIFKVEEIEIDKTIMLLNTLNTDIVLKAIVNKLINTHSTKEINMIFALAEGIWYNYDEVILNYMHDHLVPQERIGHIINDLLKYQASRKNIISY